MSIEKLLETIPEELTTTMKALCDDTRFAIVLSLLKNGEMSFSKLKETLDISSNALSHHLKVLIQLALVKNYYAKRAGVGEYSYYDATLLSRDFIDNLFKNIEPGSSVIERQTRYIRTKPKLPKKIANITTQVRRRGTVKVHSKISRKKRIKELLVK